MIELGKLFDRLPPSAPEAEQALLGSMLLDSRIIGDVVQVIRSSADFHRPAHGHIYETLVRLYDRHDAGDLALLWQSLVDRGVHEDVGGPEYLLELAEAVPTALNAVHYARVVAEKATLRRLIEAAGQILELAYHGDGDLRVVLDSAERAIFEVAQHAEKREAQSLKDLLDEAMTMIEQRFGGGPVATGLRSGFRELDDLTCGLQRGDLIILAARPSMGKTAFALNVAENVAVAGHPVGVFSMEMGRQQLAQRLLCARSEVDSQKLRRNLISAQDFERLAYAMNDLHEAPIYIDDSPGLTVLELRAKARRMVARHNVAFIVVDYLQLMASPSRENRQQEVAEISRGVKALARELEVPVLCLSQLNRSPEAREDKKPRMSDLRESGSIEQDADVVMMLHRDDYYNQTRDDYVPTNLAELIIAKQRNGPTATVKLTWVPGSTCFKDYSPQMAPDDLPAQPPSSWQRPPASTRKPPTPSPVDEEDSDGDDIPI